MALHDGIFQTIVKSAIVFPNPLMTLTLIKVSGMMNEPRFRLRYKLVSKLELRTIKGIIVKILMSTASSRFYTSYRVKDIETDEDVHAHAHIALCLAKGLKLLPEVKDTEYLIRNLSENMPRILRVLGRVDFTGHI